MNKLFVTESREVLIFAKASIACSLLVNELDIAKTNGNSIIDVII